MVKVRSRISPSGRHGEFAGAALRKKLAVTVRSSVCRIVKGRRGIGEGIRRDGRWAAQGRAAEAIA